MKAALDMPHARKLSKMCPYHTHLTQSYSKLQRHIPMHRKLLLALYALFYPCLAPILYRASNRRHTEALFQHVHRIGFKLQLCNNLNIVKVHNTE